MAQRVDGHPPSDNSGKMRLREASIITRMTNVEGMTKYEWQKAKTYFCSFVIFNSGFLRHSSFLLHRFRSAILLSLRVEFLNRRSYNQNMLHLIWYIFVGFLVGCVAKALLHTHLSITWTVVLGIVGSIIGGAVTHLFYPPSAAGKFHLGGLIVSIIGAILVLYIWHKFRLQLPRG
jgi:uncharacterized membrane protein YeaQ/YmgE (transglycosylase-associated protein family)